MAKLGDKTDFSYRVKRVTKVVDGDTIDVILEMGFNILFAQRVRLFGIDTPESRTRDLVEKKYGLKAKKFLQDKLKKAKSITIRTHKGEEKGKFGRILGDFDVYDSVKDAWRPATDVLVEEGHAVAYFGGSKEEVQMKHMANREKLLREEVVSKEDYDKAIALMEEK